MFPQTIFVSSATATLATSKAKPQGWLGEALNSLGAGNRNDTFASVVGKLHRDRWTPGDIRAVLLPHALRVQFPESELDTVIWSITRKPVLINGRGAQANSGIDQPNTEKQKLVLRTFANDYHEYDARKSGSRQMDYPTGYASFDRITTGLQRGELLIVGARTETGKTNLLLGIAHGLCTASKRVLLLSTEMSFDRIWDRYLALGEGTREHSLSVCDEFTPDLGRIRDALVESKADVFIFDHINIVGEDNQVISTFLKGLKELARELNMPGIVSAQLNRQAEWKDQEGNPVEPQLQHLKGSGAIEETAAQVLLLQVKEDADDAKYVQGYVRKNRYGEKGVVDFVLRKKPYRMVEL
jgi:replicative DNA helicase